MAGKQWDRNNNRRAKGQYFGLPHDVMASSNYVKLSAHAVKLLNDLGLQFNGKNNGCLLYTSPSPRDRTRSRMPSSA